MTGDPHAHREPPVTDGLSELGVHQAARLQASLQTVPFTHIYCSPLARAVQTAQALADPRGLNLDIRHWLEEWRPAHVMGEVADTRYETLMKEAEALRPEQTWKTSAGESLMQMADRMIPGIQALLAEHGLEAGHGGYLAGEESEDCVGVVSHGGTLNVLMMFLLGVPLRPGHPFRFEETGHAVIRFHRVAEVWYPALSLPAPGRGEPR